MGLDAELVRRRCWRRAANVVGPSLLPAEKTEARRPMCHLRLRSLRNSGSLPGMRNGSRERKRALVKRRLFNILAVMSLLLCLATAALWVRCSFRLEVFWWLSSRWDIALLASGHEMALSIGFFDTPSSRGDRGPFRYTADEALDLQKHARQFIGGGDHKFIVFLPLWLVVPASSGLAVYFRHRAKRSIRLPGLCPSCGYDLRATPDRCPECGTIPRKQMI